MAGVGAGIYNDIEEVAKQLVQWERTVEPNRENFVKYQEIKEQWQEIYAAQLDLVDRGLLTSMWKAPGI